jgi:hypothetical protein
MIRDILQTKDIDVLILDLELEGLSSIFEVKSILKNFPKTKNNIQWSFRTDLCAKCLKQVSQGMFTKRKTRTLGLSIIKVNQGKIIMNETVKKKI